MAEEQSQELQFEDIFGKSNTGTAEVEGEEHPAGDMDPEGQESQAPAEGGGEGGEASEAEGSAAEPESQEGAEDEGDAGQSQQEAQEGDDKDATIDALRDELNQLKGQLQQMQQGQSQEQQGGEDQSSQDPLSQLPEPSELYQMQVPQEMIQRLGSDDPNEFSQGIQQLANGIAATTHQQLRQEYGQVLKQEVERVRNEAVQTVESRTAEQSEAERIRQDFYGTYPEFNDSAVESIVNTVFHEEANRLGKQQYDAELRDAVGTRLRKLGIGQAAQQKQEKKEQSGPPRQMGSSSAGGTGQEKGSLDPNSPEYMAQL